ncbi:DNA-directed RNA polymerase III subunit RPC5 [Contarinia nasturtii]|uniref:DNA-directed RNA polymerase III subunit RPC5 n=1 Tax=Contarinia nasturtii TaxID=265458 RepID=UPI0012D4B779|nr:DNA-directed RNA polymerase III subunit RPC5 [Contarinia nasturtii]
MENELETSDDEIIDEIPVYFSKQLADNLYVLQYPTRKSNENKNDAVIMNSFVKPINQEIKLELKLDTASRHYDAFKGEQLAIAADGKDRGERMYNSGTMDYQTFVSSKSIDNPKRYVVGYMDNYNKKGKQMHLSLVNGIIQMRPSFSHFDKSESRRIAEQKAEQESDVEEEEPKHVTVKFARTETDRSRKAREKSFNYLLKKSEDEPWCETVWCSQDSHQAAMEREKLFSTQDESTGHALSLPANDYVDILIPAERDFSNADISGASTVCSMSKLRTFPLIDQVRYILKDAKVVSYDRLSEIINQNIYDDAKIRGALTSVGIMIHGNWVVQSDVIYPPKTVSSTNGVSAELMCRARDYIIYQFHRNEFIDRTKISTVTQVPPEEVKELLQTIAKWDGKNGWQLLQPPVATTNTRSESWYKEVETRQDNFWRAKDSLFAQMEQEARSPRRKRKISVKSTS